MDHVVSILQASGPLTSAALANRLIQSKAVRNAAHARKLIERSRSRGTILSTAPVRFDKTFLYYLPAHRGSKYKKALISLLPQKPSYHRLFKGLLANKGWMTTGQVAKLTGCLPERVTHRAGGRAPLDAVLHELIHLGLLDRDAENRAILKTGEAFGRPAISKAAFLSKLQAEQILMPHFQAWLQNSFLIAYKSHSIRPNERGSTWFNDTAWDIHGPMYLGARAEAVDSRKTKRFLVAEMNGFRRFDKNDASSTIARLQSITSRWKTISLVPLTLSQAYSPDAFSQLRDGGVAAVTYKDVFGRNIEELMRLLDRTMQETDPEAQADNMRLRQNLLRIVNRQAS